MKIGKKPGEKLWRERVQQMLVPLTIWRAAIRLAGASERSAFYKYLCGGRAYAT
jgi:hypothetical protein